MFDLITRLIETHQLIPVIAISGTFSWLTVCCCTFFIKRLFAESQRYQLISQMLQQGKPTEEILALVGGGRRQRKALGRLLNTNPSPACKTPTKSGAPPTTAVHTCVSDSSAAATPQRAHPLSTAFGYLQVPLGLLSKLAFRIRMLFGQLKSKTG